MYAILNQASVVGSIETRSNPVGELVHPDFAHLYIPIQSEDDVQIGDVYDRATGVWTRPIEESEEHHEN